MREPFPVPREDRLIVIAGEQRSIPVPAEKRFNPVDTLTKDPAAVLDYGFDWQIEGWLIGADIISSSTWAVTGSDSELVASDDEATETVTTVWLSGGTLGETYTVTNTVETSGGRADERSFRVFLSPR